MYTPTVFVRVRDTDNRPVLISAAHVSSVISDGDDCIVEMRSGTTHALPMGPHEFADHIQQQASAEVANALAGVVSNVMPVLAGTGLLGGNAEH